MLLAWKSVDAQSLGRRDNAPARQPGNAVAQTTAAPEPGTIALFASGAAPIALYLWRRHRHKK